MINYSEINDFIIKVFNYYNGKINPINKAVLDINWANLLTSNHGGYSKMPNIVVINASVINRFYGDDENVLKISIIETVIHELFHADQIINNTKYMSDINYNTFIEHACEVQTMLYVLAHTREIYNVFGVDACLSSRKNYNKWINCYDLPGIYYQRKYFHDHIFMCIDDMCKFKTDIGMKVYEYIKLNIQNKYPLVININDEKINICENGNLISIDEFNKIIIKYVSSMYNIKYKICYDEDTNTMVIDINVDVLNLMCKKV